ncbi:MAG TPA: OmpA family protein [Candidatus Angelobacter sp.]|nr:OmpA family protein [Candidatus Angelobacter sp.]
MHLSVRAIVIVVLQFFVAAWAFAGEAKSATNPPDVSAVSRPDAPEPAQQPAAKPTPAPRSQSSSDSSMRGENTPAVEVFLGYSYVRFNADTTVPGGGLPSCPALAFPSGCTFNEHFDFIPGGVAELSGNVNNWLGLVADVGGYGLHDVGGVDSRMWTFTFGPRVYITRSRFTPFVHVLAGGAHLKAQTPPGFVGDTAFFNAPQHKNSFALLGGGGLDLTASRHLAIRLFQMEYLMTRFNDGRDNRQNNLRASAGLVFRLGYHEAPPPIPVHPPTMSCTANPSTVHAETDEFITIHAETTNPDNATLTYAWSANGGSVDGTGADVRWKPGNAAAGSYTVTGHVDDGRGNVANCTVEVHVERRPNRPPTMSCQAASRTVPLGQSVQITATASDPDNDPLTYSWQASGGHITGSGAQVQFDSTGAAAGHYVVTGQVNDGRGGLAECRIDLDVQKPVEQVQLEQRLSLHSIYFPTAQPTVRNPNGGLLASQQRTLLQLSTDFKRYLTFRSDAHLVLRGHTDPRGSAQYNKLLSDRRVGSAKNFLVEHGVPAEDIETEGVGAERQLSAEEVTKLVDEDENLTPAQRLRIKKNMNTVVLAQNRRVDVLLKSAEGTTRSIREYPFSSADVLTLLAPSGPVKTAPGARKTAPGARKTAPRKTAPQKK